MHLKGTVLSAVFAAGLLVLPVGAAKAQYYGPPCTPFPLTWPICVAGAAVYTAGAIVTAPFRALTPPPPPPPAYYRPPPAAAAAPAPAYRPPSAPAAAAAPAYGYGYPYQPAYYAGDWRWQRWCYNHPRRCHNW